jgi:membrane-associated phospholipid phosphatase
VGIEPLEARELLSGSKSTILIDHAVSAASSPLSITLQVDPSTSPAGDHVAVAKARVKLVGQTSPGARVILEHMNAKGRLVPLARATSDALGQYHFTMVCPVGTTPLTVKAADAAGNTGSASMSVTRANQVIVWNSVALQLIRTEKAPPPNASRALAITQLSVFDAVNSIVPTAASYATTAKAPRSASPDAAAASAAYTALVALFPKEKAMLDAELAASLAAIPGGTRRDQGVAVGISAANQILALRSNDGSTVTVNYVPGTALGDWQPTPPAYAKALDPQWGQVTPFALASSSQFLPPPPPAITSPDFVAALNQTVSLGAANSTTRTADQTQIALFWNDPAGTSTPPGHWNEIAQQVALQNHDSLVKDARVFALLDIAEADSAIACWNGKFTYKYWRAVTAIRDAAALNNPQITPDPTFSSLITTPPFPSYVSGHSTFSSAAATVLSAIYGSHDSFTATSESLPGVTRSFTSFAQAAQEAGLSRIYGGIHYMFDNTAGLALGQQIGNYVLGHELATLKMGKG